MAASASTSIAHNLLHIRLAPNPCPTDPIPASCWQNTNIKYVVATIVVLATAVLLGKLIDLRLGQASAALGLTLIVGHKYHAWKTQTTQRAHDASSPTGDILVVIDNMVSRAKREFIERSIKNAFLGKKVVVKIDERTDQDCGDHQYRPERLNPGSFDTVIWFLHLDGERINLAGLGHGTSNQEMKIVKKDRIAREGSIVICNRLGWNTIGPENEKSRWEQAIPQMHLTHPFHAILVDSSTYLTDANERFIREAIKMLPAIVGDESSASTSSS